MSRSDVPATPTGRWPAAPNKARVCEACGWTNYPQPERIEGRRCDMRWTTPERCGGCGAMVKEPPAATA